LRGNETIFKFCIDEETELKLLEVEHAEELFALTDSCRNYLREWLPWVDETKTVEDTKSFIESSLKFSANDGFSVGIWYKGRIAGCVAYHTIDWDNRSTSIGYWLGKNFQGRGLMTKACGAMVHHALDELNLNRVEIRCAVGNFKSRAVPERLGFTKEGTLRERQWLYAHFVDLVVYGLLARDWQILSIK
jgi:ribosomal-protein-serine acetyltransferase